MSVFDYFPMLRPFLEPRRERIRRRRFVTPEGVPVHGLLAQYEDVATVTHAAEAVRDTGVRKWDMFTPFPIHGAERAMGMKRTILPLLAGMAGLTGAGLAYLMQWWMSSHYPIVVQGKPPEAWQPYVPIIFEIGILITAFTTLFGMFAFNGLPRHHHPLFDHEPFLSVSDDKFFIYIEAVDEQFDPGRTRELLQRTGASRISVIEDRPS